MAAHDNYEHTHMLCLFPHFLSLLFPFALFALPLYFIPFFLIPSSLLAPSFPPAVISECSQAVNERGEWDAAERDRERET